MVKSLEQEREFIHQAYKIKQIKKNLGDFAVGVFNANQLYFKKTNKKAQEKINEQLASLNPTSLEHQLLQKELKALQTQPDLGFFYTIHLFDTLDLPTKQIKKMIEAVISLDTMGRYFWDKPSISFEDKPFHLVEVLKRREINSFPYIQRAQKNRINTVDFKEINVTPVQKASPVIPTLDSLAEIPKEAKDKWEKKWSDLNREATSLQENKLLKEKIASLKLDYRLLSQPVTPKTIGIFLGLLVELFSHAKMQDSVKLDELNQEHKANDGISTYSCVAVLQEHLLHWLCFSLVEATTEREFSNRLQFIMGVFKGANKKSTVLPPSTTADIYFPFFMMAHLIQQSSLRFHPQFYAGMALIKRLSQCYTPESMTIYTNRFKALQGRSYQRIPFMRVHMTKALIFNEEGRSLQKEPTLKHKAVTLLIQGKIIRDYFNPDRQTCPASLEMMSKDARSIWDMVPSFFHLIAWEDLRLLMTSRFPIHRSTDNVPQQLRIFEDALTLPLPRICYREAGANEFLVKEREKALFYIEKNLEDIVAASKASSSSMEIESQYQKEIEKWCARLFVKIEQIKMSKVCELEPNVIPVVKKEGLFKSLGFFCFPCFEGSTTSYTDESESRAKMGR